MITVAMINDESELYLLKNSKKIGCFSCNFKSSSKLTS